MTSVDEPEMEMNPEKLQQSVENRHKQNEYNVHKDKKPKEQILLAETPCIDLEEKINNCILFTEQIDNYSLPPMQFEENSDNFVSNSLWLCSNMTKNVLKLDSEV